jgi:putative transcriptional regulator
MCGTCQTLRPPPKVWCVTESRFAWTGLPPASGRLLIAAPILTEETFARTVVYLLEHDGGGTVGVVINRPSHTPVGHVLPDWQDAVAEPGVVFSGGPVQPDGALCLGLAIEVPAERPGQQGLFPDSGGLRPVAEGVCTVDLDGDVELLSAMTTRLRVFAGHSGWAEGQLEDELAEGAWFVVDGSAHDVFSNSPTQLWKSVLARQPPPLRFVASYPKDPTLN